MEFKDLVKTRRSCRSFDSSPVSEDQLEAILHAGQWAPSPLNLQPWEFVIITDAEVKIKIRQAGEDARQEAIEKNAPGWVTRYGMEFLVEAPVLVVVVFNDSKGGLGDLFGQNYGAFQAASACIQNMMLAAADEGLATVWFTFFRPEKLQSILKIPEDLKIAGVIPIGKPKESIKSPPRKDPKIHRDRYITS